MTDSRKSEPSVLFAAIQFLQILLTVSGVLRPDQDFQQIVEAPIDPFAEHEAVIAREFAGVIATPQDQVIRLGNDNQLLVPFKICHIRS
jgi:hypothetical protein